MAIYEITFETTADWATFDISDGATWVKPPNETVTVTVTGDADVSRVDYGTKHVGVYKRQSSTNAVRMKGYVSTNASVLDLLMGHGDCGTSLISSPVDTAINDHLSSPRDGQNVIEKTLHLSAQGAAKSAAARQAELNAQES